jgi:hypothetical protein
MKSPFQVKDLAGANHLRKMSMPVRAQSGDVAEVWRGTLMCLLTASHSTLRLHGHGEAIPEIVGMMPNIVFNADICAGASHGQTK